LLIQTIDGRQKIVFNYGNTGLWSLWAIEELIDKVVTDVIWDSEESGKSK
jgi:hypothetical protein